MSISVNCLFLSRLRLRECVSMTVKLIVGLSDGVDGMYVYDCKLFVCLLGQTECVSMTVNCLLVCRLWLTDCVNIGKLFVW